MPGQSHENESGKAGEDLFYELLPFFFTPNQVFVEYNMANATSFLTIKKMRRFEPRAYIFFLLVRMILKENLLW